MQILECIDRVGQKYGYDTELMNALKRCIPVMIEGKTEEDINLLMDTLERVQIYTFDDQPEQEEIDAIIRRKVNGRNNHVKTIECDKGEYGKKVSTGSYISEPIFDDDMNIIDRVGFIYVTNLYSSSETSKFYGTKINISHLIHELGHAWGAQKGEFQQEESGDYTMTIGTAKFHNRVDRNGKIAEETGIEGLYMEEALNSIEEENALYRLFEINDFRNIPGYVQSNYQGTMTEMMRYFVQKFGEETLGKIRIQKDRSKIEKLQEIFDETNFMKGMDGIDYYSEKEKKLNSAQDTSMSDSAKKRIKDFFEKYRSLYLMPHKKQDFLGHLDKVMEQLFNFTSIKYSYDIANEDIKQAYYQTLSSILAEGYAPINQAVTIMKEHKKQEIPQVTLSGLARQALEAKIRIGEVTVLPEEKRRSDREEKTIDESSI